MSEGPHPRLLSAFALQWTGASESKCEMLQANTRVDTRRVIGPYAAILSLERRRPQVEGDSEDRID